MKRKHLGSRYYLGGHKLNSDKIHFEGCTFIKTESCNKRLLLPTPNYRRNFYVQGYFLS